MTSLHLPRWNELPSIPLYSDQIVTLMTQVLEPVLGSRPESGKRRDTGILTRTMLNNYVKSGLISPPVRKQYSREQVAVLLVICILKQVYSMQDIRALLDLVPGGEKQQASYDRFCDEFEKLQKKTAEASSAEASDLLPPVLLSCAAKFQVQKALRDKMEISASTGRKPR